jgi:hypothetical protein
MQRKSSAEQAQIHGGLQNSWRLFFRIINAMKEFTVPN